VTVSTAGPPAPLADRLSLEDLLEQVAEGLRPWAAKYGPSLLSMTAAEFMAWVELLAAGRTYEAYAEVLARMTGPDARAQGILTNAKWLGANEANAARKTAQAAAVNTLLEAIAAVALAILTALIAL